MKTIKHILPFLVLILFSVKTLQAQNWQPLSLGKKYNYSLHDTTFITHTLWIDSSVTSKNYLNRVVKICDTCISAQLANQLYDTLYVLSNQSQFLNRCFTNTTANIFYFYDGGASFVLHTQDTLNQTWLFDTLTNISAQLISKGIDTVFSVIDSIQKIKLSTNDTITISKNNGVLKFPAEYNSNSYYYLKGIEATSLAGQQLPRFADFFDFNAGDVLQYETIDNNFIFFPPLYKQGIEKITFLSKQTMQDTIAYQVHIVSNDSTWLGGYTPVHIKKDTVETIYFIDSAKHFTNLYPSQKIIVNHYFTNYYTNTLINQVTSGINSKGLFTKSFGVNCPNFVSTSLLTYGFAEELDSINQYIHLTKNDEAFIGREATVGLGITSSIYNNNDRVTATCLSAYIKGTDTVGTIFSTPKILSINKIQAIVFSADVFPNPAHDKIYLNYSGEKNATIELTDNFGRLIFRNFIQPKSLSEHDVSGIKSGIYFLKIVDDTNTIVKKIIIQ